MRESARVRKQSSQVQTIAADQAGLLKLLRPMCLFALGLALIWAILQPLDSTSVFDGHAQPQNLLWLLLGLGVSLDLAVNRRSWQMSALESGVLLLLGFWLLIVTIAAGQHCNPRTGWNGFWHVCGLISLFYSLRQLLIAPKERSTALMILLLGAVALSGLGWFQVGYEFPQTRAEYRRDPEAIVAKIGIEAPPGSTARQRLESRINSPEPFATFSLTNSLAVLLSAALVLSIGAVAFSRWRAVALKPIESPPGAVPIAGRALDMPQWIALGVIALLVGSVWLLTRSRVAFLAVPAGVAGLFLAAIYFVRHDSTSSLVQHARRWIKWFALTVPALGTVAVGLLWLRNKSILTDAVTSLSFRLDYWRATVAMLADHPWLGVGLGNYQSYYPRYMLASASETIADPHNWILDLAINGSIPFAVMVCTSLLLTVWRASRPRLDDVPSSWSWNALATGAVMGLVVVLFALYLFGMDGETLFALWLSSCVALVLGWTVRQALHGYFAVDMLAPGSALLTMLICLLISGSWQAAGISVPVITCWALCRPRAATEITSDQKRVYVPLVLTAVVVIAFLWQSWFPVLQSSALVHSSPRSIQGQLESINLAREADSANADWDRYRAQLLVQAALEIGDPQRLQAAVDEAVAAVEHWVSRESVSFLSWQFAGDRMLELQSQQVRLGLSGDELQQKSTAAYARAVQLRPGDAGLRVQLAYGLFLAGERAAARSEIEEAEKISENTPHFDQRLKWRQVLIPRAPADLTTVTSRPPNYDAEPVVEWLRKQLSSN